MALIELKRIYKSFTMGAEVINALKDVSLTIDHGDFISIIGPSGCGKTTLMNLLGLLDRPEKGTYLLEGKPMEALSDNDRARLRNEKIGFVFQTFNLLPRATALRNVEMPLVYAAGYNRSLSKIKVREMARTALRRAALEGRMDHRPNELSGGERQRCAIARAIVNQPRILLADEPTGNLDSKTGNDILSLFEELNRQGVTIVMVTHDSKIAARAQRIISMLDGEIVRDERLQGKNSHANP